MPGFMEMKMQQHRGQQKSGAEDIVSAGDPGNGLGMYRVHREERSGEKGKRDVPWWVRRERPDLRRGN